MYPSGSQWTVRGFDSAGGIGAMTADYVCKSAGGMATVKFRDVVPAGGTLSPRAKCKSNLRVVGGGVATSGSPDASQIVSSYPDDFGDGDGIPDNGWKVKVNNYSGQNLGVNVYAMCMR